METDYDPRQALLRPMIPARQQALFEHRHPFEAKALILAGEIAIRVAGEETVYRAGQVFHLPADTPHCERYGPAGVRYLVGRRP